MMLIMITYIEGYFVQGTIITISFLVVVVHQVVFLDPSSAEGMKTNRKEKAQCKKSNSLRPKQPPRCRKKCTLYEPVQGNPSIKWFDLFQSGNTKCLEQRIEQQPECFTYKIIVD